jgi:hypothetical protein
MSNSVYDQDESSQIDLLFNGEPAFSLIRAATTQTYSWAESVEMFAHKLKTFISQRQWSRFVLATRRDDITSPADLHGRMLVQSIGFAAGTIVEHESWDSYVNAKDPRGLGGAENLKRVLDHLPESYRTQIENEIAAVTLKTVSEVRSEAGKLGNDIRWKGETSQSYHDNFAISTSEKQRGTSPDYIRTRLLREGRQDLVKQVELKNISWRQASIQAGFRKASRNLTIPDDMPPERIADKMLNFLNAEAICVVANVFNEWMAKFYADNEDMADLFLSDDDADVVPEPVVAPPVARQQPVIPGLLPDTGTPDKQTPENHQPDEELLRLAYQHGLSGYKRSNLFKGNGDIRRRWDAVRNQPQYKDLDRASGVIRSLSQPYIEAFERGESDRLARGSTEESQ